MRLHIISDLHLEFLTYASAEQLIARLFGGADYTADILLMAGDLCTLDDKVVRRRYSLLLQQSAKLFKHVVVVAGNHELYDAPGDSFNEKEQFVMTTLTTLTAAAGPNVHFLQRSSITLEGIRIVGCTLWTKLDEVAYHSMRDSEVVFHDMHEYNQAHQSDLSWLKNQLTTQDIQSAAHIPTIVMTHHLPSYKMIAPQYATSTSYSGFACELDQLITDAAASCQLKLWVCGHTHTKMAAQIAGVDIMCNPNGYPGEIDAATVMLQSVTIPSQPPLPPATQLGTVLQSADVLFTFAAYLDVYDLLALQRTNQLLSTSCRQQRLWHGRHLVLTTKQTALLIQHISTASLPHLQRLTLLGTVLVSRLPLLFSACPSLTHFNADLYRTEQSITLPTDVGQSLRALQLSAPLWNLTAIEQALVMMPSVGANLQQLVLADAPRALLKLSVNNRLRELHAPWEDFNSGWVNHIASFPCLERLELTRRMGDKYFDYRQHAAMQQLTHGFPSLRHVSIAVWSEELMDFYSSRHRPLQSLQLVGPSLGPGLDGHSPDSYLDSYLTRNPTCLQHLTSLTIQRWGLCPTNVRRLLAQPALLRLELLTCQIPGQIPGITQLEAAYAVEPVASNLQYLQVSGECAGRAALCALAYSTSLKVLSVHFCDVLFTELTQNRIRLPASIECLHWTSSVYIGPMQLEGSYVTPTRVASWFPVSGIWTLSGCQCTAHTSWTSRSSAAGSDSGWFSACRTLETVEIEIDVPPTHSLFLQAHTDMLEAMSQWSQTSAPTLHFRHRADSQQMRVKPTLQVMGLNSSSCPTCSIVDKYTWHDSIGQQGERI